MNLQKKLKKKSRIAPLTTFIVRKNHITHDFIQKKKGVHSIYCQSLEKKKLTGRVKR